MTKICNKCKKEKSLSEYHKNKNILGGHKHSCKNCRLEIEKVYRLNNAESIARSNKKYREKTKKERSIKSKKRFHIDIQYRLTCNLRTRLNMAIKSNQKSGSAVDDLGCSIEDLKWWLEFWFDEGMNWGNYGNKQGQWSIDHIRPLTSFNLAEHSQFLKANNYKNLQPLWHIDNMRKGNKI
jgi:hypothetical protein